MQRRQRQEFARRRQQRLERHRTRRKGRARTHARFDLSAAQQRLERRLTAHRRRIGAEVEERQRRYAAGLTEFRVAAKSSAAGLLQRVGDAWRLTHTGHIVRLALVAVIAVGLVTAALLDRQNGAPGAAAGITLLGVPTARSVYALLGWYPARLYGALGNNSHDDGPALQRASDAAAAVGGGDVRLRTGIFLTSISVVAHDGVHFWGQSANFRDTTRGTTIQTTSAGALVGVPIINVNNTKFAGVHRLTLAVAGADSTANTTLGISDFTDTTHQATFLTVEDCTFRYFGGVVIGLYGNVNYIFRNRADDSNSHFIHLKSSVTGPGLGGDSFVCFNESGGAAGNGSGGGANGSAIRLEAGANSTVEGNHLYNFKYGIEVYGGAYNQIIGNRCEKHDSDGILLDNASFGNTVSDNHVFNCGYVASKVGINLKAGAVRNKVSDNHVFNEASFAGGTNMDTGILLSGSGSRNEILDNLIYNMTNNGIRLDAETFSSVRSNKVDTCGHEGIVVQNVANDNAIVGNTVYKAGQTTDNTYDSILLNTNCDRNTVNNNTIKHGGGANQARTGIRINTSDCDNTSVVGNDLTAAGRVALTDNGTSTFIRHNKGFVTENGGTGTVASGTTSVVITHGLGFTPTVRDITITPSNNLGSAKVLFLSGAPTSTQFTVASDVDPGATTATFGWGARRVLNN